MPLPLLKTKPGLPPHHLFFSLDPEQDAFLLLRRHPDLMIVHTSGYNLQKWTWETAENLKPEQSCTWKDLPDLSTGQTALCTGIPSSPQLEETGEITATLIFLWKPEQWTELTPSLRKVWSRATLPLRESNIQDLIIHNLLSKKEKWGYTECVLFSVLSSSLGGLPFDLIHKIFTGQKKKYSHYPGFAELKGTGKRELIQSLLNLINSGKIIWNRRYLCVPRKGQR